MPLKEYKFTDEHRKNLSISHKGYKWTEEQRKNFRIATLGHPVSDKVRKKFTGLNNPRWQGGKPKCPICGKQLSRRESKSCNKHKPFSEETRKKIGEAAKGEKNGQWIKDRTQLVKKQERNDYAYKDWRYQVFKRDRHICRINNKDCCGSVIAHHILSWREYPELRYNINNGITLCQAHHPRKRAEEKTLISVFQELVPVSKIQHC
jgi:hypothetical protein